MEVELAKGRFPAGIGGSNRFIDRIKIDLIYDGLKIIILIIFILIKFKL